MTITRMATITMAIMAATGTWMTPTALGAGAHASRPQQKLTVYFQDKANVPNEVRIGAEAMASQMFAEIGISLNWSAAKPVRSSADEPLIIIEPVSGTPERYMPGALAYAMPYEGVHIKIFFDRIAPGTAPARSTTLGHVMVHEITHLLQGFSHHSDRGIMKARWTLSDLCAMRHKPLAFTEEDVNLIYRGLLPRPARTGTLVAELTDARGNGR